MCNMKAISLLVQKLMPRLSFLSKVDIQLEVKVVRSKFLHRPKGLAKEYTCVI